MPDTKASLFFHPVRIRIVTELTGGPLTSKDLANALSDVAQATLYRHINTLLEGEIITIVEENQIRGTVERVYALRENDVLRLSPEDLEDMTRADYEQAFAIFMTSFMGDANRYLDSKEGQKFNPVAEGIGLNKCQVYLSDEERKALEKPICDLIEKLSKNEPAPGRKRHTFGLLLFPIE